MYIKKLISVVMVVSLAFSIFSLQSNAEELEAEEVNMSLSDLQSCYNVGTEMLDDYYSATILGTDADLNDYYTAPLLAQYTEAKVAESQTIKADEYEAFSNLETNYSLLEYTVTDEYICCEIAVDVRYTDAWKVGDDKVSGFGEPVKVMLVKAEDGYKIADWYIEDDFGYDSRNRLLSTAMDDPDIWLTSDAYSTLEKCEQARVALIDRLNQPMTIIEDDVVSTEVNQEIMPLATTLTAFNKTAMVNYAKTNCSKAVPTTGSSSQVSTYVDYAEIGGSNGDCTNFISHVMLSGGAQEYDNDTPLSATGWYFNSSSDRSSSWTGVVSFHTYVTNNYSNHNKGPAGASTEYTGGILLSPSTYNNSLCSVIQVKKGDGGTVYDHSTVITGFRVNTDGLYQPLICSRTSASKYNLDALVNDEYGQYKLRLISLVGHYK